MRKLFICSCMIVVAGCSTLAGRSETIDFRHFVREFFASEAFQVEHIRFPLEVVTYRADSDITSKPVTRADWSFLKGPAYYQCQESCYDIMIYDDFAKTQRNTGKRTLAFEGVGNGINSSMYFELIDGKWHLVKIEDFDN